jgi:ankyrin repeat protein
VCPYNRTLVAHLLRLGADPNLGPGCSGTYGHPLGTRLIPDSGSSLRGAVRQGSLECLTLLIQAGGNLAKAKLMHPAIESRDVTVIAHVLHLGADVDETDDLFKTGYPIYRTPLLRAIKLGDTDAVAFLLENGANVMKAGYDGFTPLDIVKMECCGGRSPCRVGMHGRDILPEIRDLIEKAVERARSLGVSTDGKQAPLLEGHETAE